MLSAFLAAIAAMSRLCSLLSFLIPSPLARRCSPRRNNPYSFLTAPIVPSVNDKKHDPRVNGSQSDPSLFVFRQLVSLRQSTRIIKNKNRGFKANFVFEQVPPILVLVPFETHGRTSST
jgi:hypothetical protein